MSVLKALWDGELAPSERPIDPTSRYARCERRMMEREEQVKALLPGSARQAFDAYCDERYELAAASEEDGFLEGFRLGARIMMEVLRGK